MLCGQGIRLYVFSDGVYEFEKTDGAMWHFHEFAEYLQKIKTDGYEVQDRLYDYVKDLRNSANLDNDLKILEVVFT